MLRDIPNFITLLNLFFGCLAIVHIMGVHPRIEQQQEQLYVIEGMEDMIWGSLFIGIAVIMDVLDGLAARMLKAYSHLGKDLDSLADVVSFGVAPAMIMYQLLWRSYMMEPGALQTPLLVLIPAFLIPLAGAYRLARFNHRSMIDTGRFEGMPIPATGLLVGVIPVVLFFSYDSIGFIFENRWVLYGIILLVSYLMVSTFPFLKWNTPTKSFLPQIIIILVSIISIVFLGWGGLIVGFLTYLVMSISGLGIKVKS